MLIVGISDYIGTRTIIQVARRMNPELYIIARTRYMNEIRTLSQMGANEIIPEEYETSVEIFSRLLKKYLVPEEDIFKFTREIRSNGYSMLRKHSIEDRKSTFNLKEDLPGVDVTSFKIKENCVLHGNTLIEANLRNMYGATVLAIRRGEQIITNPGGDTQLLSGDLCIVLGKPEKLCQLRIFLEGEAGSSPTCSL